VTIVLQRSVTRLPLSEVRNRGGKPSSRNHGEDICHDPRHAKIVAITAGHQLPLTHRALTVPQYQISRVLNRLFLYSCSKPEHPPVGDHSCTTGNRSQNLCYDIWSLGHLGINSPGDKGSNYHYKWRTLNNLLSLPEIWHVLWALTSISERARERKRKRGKENRRDLARELASKRKKEKKTKTERERERERRGLYQFCFVVLFCFVYMYRHTAWPPEQIGPPTNCGQ